MIIRNNSVLGKFISSHNMKLSDTNLTYVLKRDGHLICEILLTNNVQKIVEFFDISYEEFNEMDSTAFFTWIATHKNFKYKSFMNLRSKKPLDLSEMLMSFYEWLDKSEKANQPTINKDNFIKKEVSEISGYFNLDIERLVEEQTDFFDNKHIVKNILNGKNLLEKYPSFVKTNIPDFMFFVNKFDLYEKYLQCKLMQADAVIELYANMYFESKN